MPSRDPRVAAESTAWWHFGQEGIWSEIVFLADRRAALIIFLAERRAALMIFLAKRRMALVGLRAGRRMAPREVASLAGRRAALERIAANPMLDGRVAASEVSRKAATDIVLIGREAAPGGTLMARIVLVRHRVVSEIARRGTAISVVGVSTTQFVAGIGTGRRAGRAMLSGVRPIGAGGGLRAKT